MRVKYEFSGSAVCPFDGETYAYTATLTLKGAMRVLKLESVSDWVAECPSGTAEDVALTLAEWAADAVDGRAKVTVRHEEKDGIRLTARATATAE